MMRAVWLPVIGFAVMTPRGLHQSDKEWLGTDLNDLDDWDGFHLALLDEE